MITVSLSPGWLSWLLFSSLGALIAATMELISRDALCSPWICHILHFDVSFITWCIVEDTASISLIQGAPGMGLYAISSATTWNDMSLIIPSALDTRVTSPQVISLELFNPESSCTFGMTWPVSSISSITRN